MSEQIGLGEERCGNCSHWHLDWIKGLIEGDCFVFHRTTQNHQTCSTEMGRLALSDPQSSNYNGEITESRFSPYAPEREINKTLNPKGEENV
jgi:hypothetical protein